MRDAIRCIPHAARLYTVLFTAGREKGDCTLWSQAVLEFFLYDVQLTIKGIRLEASFLAQHGFTSQAHKNKVRTALCSYGFPDCDPQDLVDNEVHELKAATAVTRWGSVYEAISETEEEALNGEAFELTGILVTIASTSLRLKHGWVSPPTTSRPLVTIQEMHTRDFAASVHPFTSTGRRVRLGERRGFLLANGCHHEPAILVHLDDPLAVLASGARLSPPASLTAMPPQEPACLPAGLASSFVDSLSAPLPAWTTAGLTTELVAWLADRGEVPTYLVVFDGSCVDNGSTNLARVPRAGAGFSVLCHTRNHFETVVEGGAWLGKGDNVTNNYAEFMACYLKHVPPSWDVDYIRPLAAEARSP